MIQFTNLCSPCYNVGFLALEKTNYCGYLLVRFRTIYEHLTCAGCLREHAWAAQEGILRSFIGVYFLTSISVNVLFNMPSKYILYANIQYWTTFYVGKYILPVPLFLLLLFIFMHFKQNCRNESLLLFHFVVPYYSINSYLIIEKGQTRGFSNKCCNEVLP